MITVQVRCLFSLRSALSSLCESRRIIGLLCSSEPFQIEPRLSDSLRSLPSFPHLRKPFLSISCPGASMPVQFALPLFLSDSVLPVLFLFNPCSAMPMQFLAISLPLFAFPSHSKAPAVRHRALPHRWYSMLIRCLLLPSFAMPVISMPSLGNAHSSVSNHCEPRSLFPCEWSPFYAISSHSVPTQRNTFIIHSISLQFVLCHA
jgi:hypothetical protein